jgi:hypothetical protein
MSAAGSSSNPDGSQQAQTDGQSAAAVTIGHAPEALDDPNSAPRSSVRRIQTLLSSGRWLVIDIKDFRECSNSINRFRD